MAESNKRVVEIDGIKLEVDLRHARRVDTFKVGDRVKILKKEYSSTNIYHGVIVGFENFASMPTIVVAYVESSYNSAEIKLAYINGTNNDDKKVELVPDTDQSMAFSKADILAKFNRQIESKLEEIRDIYRKQRYFNAQFGKMFNETPEGIRQAEIKLLHEEQERVQAVLDEEKAAALLAEYA
jgi:hypothetical protein